MSEKQESSNAHQMSTLQPENIIPAMEEERIDKNEVTTKKNVFMDYKEILESSEEDELNPELMDTVCSTSDYSYSCHWLMPGLQYVDPYKRSHNNYVANYLFAYYKSTYARYMKNQQFFNAVFLLRKGWRMKWFEKRHIALYEILGEEKYYELLAFCYTMQNRHHYNTRHFYSKLIWHGKNPSLMMEEDEKVEFEKLPEKITIYRGIETEVNIIKTNLRKYAGNAWTTSFQKAINYASGDKHQILKLEIKKSDVIALFGTESDNEIFIDLDKNKHLIKSVEVIDANNLTED